MYHFKVFFANYYVYKIQQKHKIEKKNSKMMHTFFVMCIYKTLLQKGQSTIFNNKPWDIRDSMLTKRPFS